MPYITKEQQQELLPDVGAYRGPENPGELNFCFTDIIVEYLDDQGICYQAINDIIGALEQAKDEFRRRIIHPYEDRKILENGDVYAPRN